MKFLSVCSGIEAASVAWVPLGWKPWAVAEIDAFPATVLHHHYGTGRPHHMPSPDADDLTQEQRDDRALAITRVARLPLRTLADGPVNFGDMTAYKEWPDASLDVLCGGTPCQSFSNAGLRAGLDDPRGQLMLTFGAIAARYRPDWLVWENVPGVLSSNEGRDFGSFLGLLGFLGYGFAYRVLDAQFVRVDGHGRAVPQRRNRVFVVGCLGDWRSAAAVLLERESLRGDPAPRRQAGTRAAATLTRGAEGSGGSEYAGRRREDDVNIIAGAITAGMGRRSAEDPERDLLVAGTLTGGGDGAGWRIGADEAAGHQLVVVTLTAQIGEQTGDDVKNGNLVPAFGGNNTAGAIHVATACRAHGGSGHIDFESETFIAHTLRADGFDASEDGTGRGTPLVPICFDPTQITHGENRSNPQSGDPFHTLAKGTHAPVIAFNARQDPINGPINGPIDTDGSTNGVLVPAMAFPARTSGTQYAGSSNLSPSLGALNPMAIAFQECWREGGRNLEIHGDLAYALTADGTTGGRSQARNILAPTRQVRRLTPTECERLMGFPDGYTAVTWRGKPAADGPRYKALGNSWAINCARWVGRRIALVDSIRKATP